MVTPEAGSGSSPHRPSIDEFIAEVLGEGLQPALPDFLGPEWDARLVQLRTLLEGFTTSLVVQIDSADGRTGYIQARWDVELLEVEAVSNEFLDGDAVLDPEAVRRLLEMGWQPPQAPDHPNFHRTFPQQTNMRELAWLMASTFHEAYRFGPEDTWSVVPQHLAALLDTSSSSGPEHAAEPWEQVQLWIAQDQAVAAAIIRRDNYWFCTAEEADDLPTLADRGAQKWREPFTTLPSTDSGFNLDDLNRLRAVLPLSPSRAHRLSLPCQPLQDAWLHSDGSDPAQWLLSALSREARPLTTLRYPSMSVHVTQKEPNPAERATILDLALGSPTHDHEKKRLWALAVAIHPLRYLPRAAENEDPVIRALAITETTLLEHIDGEALVETSEDLQQHFARHPDTPEQLLIDLATLSRSRQVPHTILDRPTIPPEVLNALGSNGDPAIRAIVAARSDIHPKLAEELLRDSVPTVRHTALSNPAISVDMLLAELPQLPDPEAVTVIGSPRVSYHQLVATGLKLTDARARALLLRPDCPIDDIVASPWRRTVIGDSHVPAEVAQRVLDDQPTTLELLELASRDDVDSDAVRAALHDRFHADLRPWIDALRREVVSLPMDVIFTAEELLRPALNDPDCPTFLIERYLTSPVAALRGTALQALLARGLNADPALLRAAKEHPVYGKAPSPTPPGIVSLAEDLMSRHDHPDGE